MSTYITKFIEVERHEIIDCVPETRTEITR